MGALANETAVVDDENFVGEFHELWFMSDHDDGVVFFESFQNLGDFLRSFVVERAGDLIKEKNFRARKKRASKGEELLLPSREVAGVFDQASIIFLREFHDFIVDAGDFAGLDLAIDIRVN